MTGTAQLVAVLGQGVVPTTSAVLTADDLGLTRGDGVFDATRVMTDDEGHATAEHVDLHLARFARSARIVDLPEPDPRAWKALIAEALAAWHHPGEAALKMMLTRGPEHQPSTPSAPSALLTITSTEPGNRRPLKVVLLDRGYSSHAFAAAPWLLGGAKLLSYGVNTSAKREAARRGADDAIFVSSDGYVLEAPTAAVIWLQDGILRTSHTGATGILESVTVTLIESWAGSQGVGFEHALIQASELPMTEGIWLASSVRGVCPVVAIDGRRVAANPEWTARISSAAGF